MLFLSNVGEIIMSVPDNLIRLLCSGKIIKDDEVDWQLVENSCASLSYPLKAANQNDITNEIEQQFNEHKVLELEFINQHVATLTKLGFSNEAAQTSIALLIAILVVSWNRNHYKFDNAEEGIRLFEAEKFSDLLVIVFDCLLCGRGPGLSVDVAEWVLEMAKIAGSTEAKNIKEILKLANTGDPESLRKIVVRGYNAWKIIEGQLSQDFSFHADSLGLLYQFMCKLENDPVVKLRLAMLLKLFGHAGDETEADQLIAESALDGNYGAWEVIRDHGDYRLIEALISEGQARATIMDNGPNAILD